MQLALHASDIRQDTTTTQSSDLSEGKELSINQSTNNPWIYCGKSSQACSFSQSYFYSLVPLLSLFLCSTAPAFPKLACKRTIGKYYNRSMCNC